MTALAGVLLAISWLAPERIELGSSIPHLALKAGLSVLAEDEIVLIGSGSSLPVPEACGITSLIAKLSDVEGRGQEALEPAPDRRKSTI